MNTDRKSMTFPNLHAPSFVFVHTILAEYYFYIILYFILFCPHYTVEFQSVVGRDHLLYLYLLPILSSMRQRTS